MQNKLVLKDKRDAALWLTLNRPEVMNALSSDLISALAECLDEAVADREIRVLVITGAGKAFCAGADLEELNGGDPTAGSDAVASLLSQCLPVFQTLEHFPKPVIGAVNGLACAGGLELLLCCDLVVACESAMFADAHANYGILPGAGATYRLPMKIGLNRAKYLMLTGEFLTAEQLQEAGLVNRVASEGQLAMEVDWLAGKLQEKSPLGLTRMKRLLNESPGREEAAALRDEIETAKTHTRSADFQEGLLAFQQRRRPNFSGR